MPSIEDQLTLHEALRLKPYRCTAGKLTIGVGRNLDDVGISAAEARQLLANDIANVRAQLDKALPWWVELDAVRQKVLIDLCFNMGISSLLGFKNTLAAVRAGDWQKASLGMLASKWANDVGPTRSQRLAGMMRTGQDYVA